MPLLLFIFSFLIVIQAQASDCPSLPEIRSEYFANNIEKAIEGADCRISRNERDFDTLRFLSNLYWWENDTTKSREAAQRIIKHEETHEYDELMLHLQKKTHRFRMFFNYEDEFATHDTGYNIHAKASLRYFKKNEISFEFSRDSKLFKFSPRQTDYQYELEHVGVLSKQVYMYTSGAFVKDAKILPRWTGRIEPHFVFAHGSDISLGIEYRNYDLTDEVIILVGGWQYPLSSHYSVGLRLYTLVTPRVVVSAQSQIRLGWTARQETRLFFAGGKTDEGDGIIDTFFTGAFSWRYHITIPLAVMVTGRVHRGDLREENRMGVGFEYYL